LWIIIDFTWKSLSSLSICTHCICFCYWEVL
jgi:hypothetical protein